MAADAIRIGRTMGLTEAAARLFVPYQTARDLLLVGAIQGRKDGTRWVVDAADVERLARERGIADRWAADAAPQAA